jgi:hypothetical protein
MCASAVPGAGHEYDVCLSFAGEQRAYVEQVAHILHDRGKKVFYDGDETVQLWAGTSSST